MNEKCERRAKREEGGGVVLSGGVLLHSNSQYK